MPRIERHRARCLAALTLGAALLLGPARGQAALPEYEVKAALLVKLAKFVNWPPSAQAPDAFRVCVLGTDPFGASLDALRSERIGGRAVQVTRLLSVERVATSCQLVFVSPLDGAIRRETTAQLAASGVLTISDQTGFAHSGGMIGMVTRNRKISFEVNLAALKRSGLELSSQFLQLATVVESAEGRNP